MKIKPISYVFWNNVLLATIAVIEFFQFIFSSNTCPVISIIKTSLLVLLGLVLIGYFFIDNDRQASYMKNKKYSCVWESFLVIPGVVLIIYFALRLTHNDGCALFHYFYETLFPILLVVLLVMRLCFQYYMVRKYNRSIKEN